MASCVKTAVKLAWLCYIEPKNIEGGGGGNLNLEKNEKKWTNIILQFEILPSIVPSTYHLCNKPEFSSQ